MIRYPEGLDTLLSVEDFRMLCPNLSATDEQVAMVLESVSAAIRAWCGWHVAPLTKCQYTGNGSGKLLMLPAMGVQSVESFKVLGNDVPYEWHEDGMTRLKSGEFPTDWQSVTCDFTAGFTGQDVGQAVAQIVSNAIVAAPGVSSEHAGNVSISYNKTGDGITGGVSLLARDYGLLAPYRLYRAW